MNKLLAEALSFLNGFFALMTVVIGGIIGKYLGPYCFRLYAQLNGLVFTASDSQAELFGIIIGIVTGFFVAVAVFGLLALFIQMHRELKSIHRELSDAGQHQAPAPHVQIKQRTTPTLGTQL